jgi:predicted ATPase
MNEFKNKRLTSIYFTGYRNLVDCFLPLENMAVLVGPNNSGKSNFLDLFTILGKLHFTGKEGKEEVANRIQGNGDPIVIKLEGEMGESKKAYEVSYEIKISHKAIGTNASLVIESETFSYKKKSQPGKRKLLFHRKPKELLWKKGQSNFKKFDISPDEPALSVIKASLDNVTPNFHELELYVYFMEYFAATVFSIHSLRSSYKSMIKKIQKEIFPLQEKKDAGFIKFKNTFSDILGLSEFKIINLTSKIKDIDEEIFTCMVRENFRTRLTSLDNMSDGTKILFLMLYHIFIKHWPLINIEEPEIGLHPQALSKVISIFLNNETDSQVIITTHSAYIVNLINPKNIFLMEGNEKKISKIVPVSKIQNLEKRLKSKYVNFGDLLVENFASKNIKKLEE